MFSRINCWGCGTDVEKKKLTTGVLLERYRGRFRTIKRVWLCMVCSTQHDKMNDAVYEVCR
jgi:DNA-directed RNA polymerase subunit RPC12/RpoP